MNDTEVNTPITPVESPASPDLKSSTGKTTKAPLVQRIKDFLLRPPFADDVFISYSRADGATYAAGLATKLADQEFACRFDQWGTKPGGKIPRELRRALKRSALLVLVGTPEAASSEHVADEVAEFKKTGRNIIPIIHDGVRLKNGIYQDGHFQKDQPGTPPPEIHKALWAEAIFGAPLSFEKKDSRVSGNPSEEILNRIKKNFTFKRKDERLRKAARLLGGFLAFLTVAVAIITYIAVVKGAEAVEKTRIADEQTKAAREAGERALKEEQRANDQAIKANEQQARAKAEQARAEEEEQRANDQQARANAEEGRANREQQRADTERVRADEEEQRTGALKLVSLARSNIAFDPSFSVLLASEALNKTAPPLSEALDTMRRSIEASHLDFIIPASKTEVTAAAFSHSGEYVGTVSQNEAQIWDAHTGTLTSKLNGHQERIRSIAFSPREPLALTSSEDGTARIWNIGSGKSLRELKPNDYVDQAVFSPDGSSIFTISTFDRKARIWTRSGPSWEGPVSVREITLKEQNDWEVGVAAFSPDGKSLVAVNLKGATRVWNVNQPTSRQVCRASGVEDDRNLGPTGNDKTGRPLAFSQDGKYFAVSNRDNKVRVWETGKCGDVIATLPTGDITLGVALDSTGKRVVTSGFGGKIQIWDIHSGKRLAQMESSEIASMRAEFNRDGTLVIGTNDDLALVWDACTGEHLATLRGHIRPITVATFGQADDSVLTASMDGTARVWRFRSDAFNHTVALQDLFPTPMLLDKVSFNPEGRLAVTRRDPNNNQEALIASVWDATSGAHITDLRHPASIASSEFDRNGRLVITSSDDGTVRWWDARSGRNVYTMDGFPREGLYAASAQDARIVATFSAGVVRVWERESRRVIARFGISVPPARLVLSKDGNKILVAVGDSAFLVPLDKYPDDGSNLRSPENDGENSGVIRYGRHLGVVPDVEFSSDERYVATASADSTARVWESSTGKLISTMRGHTRGVFGVAFSQDSTFVATSGGDGSVRVWEATTGSLVQVLEGRRVGFVHSRPIFVPAFDVVFGPTDRQVFSIKFNGIWQRQTCDLCGSASELIRLAESRTKRRLTPDERRVYLQEQPSKLN